MGRLDRRTADDEDDRSAQQAAEQLSVSRAQQLREAQAEAARTAAQETLVAEVYDLVDEFLELMEAQDYPHLTTVTLPMTRWWWPFPHDTRKAVWTVFRYNGAKNVVERSTYVNEDYNARYTWHEHVYLLPGGQLFYRLEPLFSSGHSPKKAAFRDWDGEHAQKVKEMLESCISFLRTGRSDRFLGSWPPAFLEAQNLDS